jgi:hypothetical protein
MLEVCFLYFSIRFILLSLDWRNPMIAELIHEEDCDLDDALSYHKQPASRIQRQTSSKAKWNTQSRYRRTKSGAGLGGSHRRRQRQAAV